MGKDVTVCCICDQKKLSRYDEWEPYDTIIGWSEDYEASMMFLHDWFSSRHHELYSQV